jgi:hypothetical protein
VAILESQQQPTDIPATVLDLLKGFAVLARVQAPTMPKEHAFTALELVQRLLERAERCDWEESADLLREADAVLNIRIAPPR